MKKLLFLLLALTIAVGASAGIDSRRDHHPAKKAGTVQSFTERVSHKTPAMDRIAQKAQRAQDKPQIKNIFGKFTNKLGDGSPEVITEQPEGTLVPTHMSYTAYYFNYDAINPESANVPIVYAPDGETVYLDLFGGWVRGTISGDKIHVPLGQYIYYDETQGSGIILTWGSANPAPDVKANLWFYQDPNVTEATFTINDNRITLDNSSGGGAEAIGATGLAFTQADGTDCYIMIWGLSFIVAPTAIIEQPEGDLVYYKRSGSYYSFSDYAVKPQMGVVSMVYAPDGTTVYIKDLVYEDGNGAWVKGTIANGKVTVPLGQYTYTYYDNTTGDYQYGIFLTWSSVVMGYDEYYEEYCPMFQNDPTVTEVTYTIDGDNLVLDNAFGTSDGIGATGLGEMWDDGDWGWGTEWNTVFTPTEYPPTIIEDQPEGTLVTYTRSVQEIDYMNDNTYIGNGLHPFNVVYAPDGQTVYIQDPVYLISTGVWVKGSVNGNKITVPLGQYIYYEEDFGVITAWGTNTMGGKNYVFEYDPTVTEVTYTIDDEGYVTMDNSTADLMGEGATGLAVIRDNGWETFAMEWNAPVYPSPIYEQPEGELVTYNRNGYYFNYSGDILEQNGTVNLVYAPDGQTVYIQDIFFNSDIGTWVQGTIQDGKIHVPLYQCVYWNDEYNYGIMLGWGFSYYDEDNSEYRFNSDPNATEVTFTIDGDVISLDNTEYGPYGDANGATVLGAVYTDAPIWFEQCELMTVFTIPPSIITEQPEGTYQKYFRTIHTSDYKDRDKYYRNGIAEMVFADNSNVVYIKGIVYGLSSAWIRGTIVDNKIHVPLGQCLDIDGDYYAKLRWVYETVETGVYGEYIDTHPDYDVTEATFTIDGDKITLDENNEWSSPQNQHESLGVCWYNSSGTLTNVWPANLEIQFMPYFVPTVIEDTPEGELVTYYRRGHAIGHMSEMYLKDRDYEDYCIWPHQYFEQDDLADVVYAPDGRTVYLCEPVQCRANVHEPRYTWVMGTLSEDGHKIIVPLEQYVTWNPSTHTAERLGWGTSHVRTNRYGEDEIYIVPDNSVMTVSYTIEDGFLSMDNTPSSSKSDWAQGNTGLTITDQFGHWHGELNWGTKYAGDHPAVPMDPVIVYWEDNGDENGNSALLTMYEPTDVDGYGINEQGLSYSIYTDNGKLFTFEASKYGLQEDATEITYDMWQDHYQLRPDCIYFYRTNAEGYEPFFNWRIGIQLHYTNDGVKQSSNIVYLEVFEKPEEPEMPGDVNGDGNLTVADVTLLIRMVLNGDDLSSANDVNGDGILNIGDVTLLIGKVLRGEY